MVCTGVLARQCRHINTLNASGTRPRLPSASPVLARRGRVPRAASVITSQHMGSISEPARARVEELLVQIGASPVVPGRPRTLACVTVPTSSSLRQVAVIA